MYLLENLMKRFVKVGTLTILDVEGKPHVFQGTAGPEVTIRLRDRKLYRSLFLHPELKAGEAYMDGTLTIEKGTIRDFLTLSVMNARNLRSRLHCEHKHKDVTRRAWRRGYCRVFLQ